MKKNRPPDFLAPLDRPRRGGSLSRFFSPRIVDFSREKRANFPVVLFTAPLALNRARALSERLGHDSERFFR
jgi:hypothetical protein